MASETALGPRARETRRRLLEAAAHCIRATNYRYVRVQDVAREAGTSAASFYQYFSDLESALLVLSEGVYDDAVNLAERALISTSDSQDHNASFDIPNEIMAFCADNCAVLRLTNLCAEEGREAFVEVRTAIWEALTSPIPKLIHGNPAGLPRQERARPIVAALMEAGLRVHPASHLSLIKALGPAWLP